MMNPDNSWLKSDNQQENYGYLNRFKSLGWLIVIFTLFLTIIFWFLNIDTSYDPVYLIFILNIAFVAIPSFFIAITAHRGFLNSGIWFLLWMGIGALTFGLATVISSLLMGWTNVNVAITFHNIMALFAAALFFIGSFFIINRIPPQENSYERLFTALQVYTGASIFITFIAIISINEFLPPFFVEGVGGTIIRQIVVGFAALFFFLSGLMIFRQYLRSNSLLLYWFSLGLFLMFLGMVGILIQTATGTPLNWIGRSTQLLGGVYLFMAALVALNVAIKRDLPASQALASFFQERKQNLNLLFDSITDAIIVSDKNFIITGWNKGAEKIYGWKAEEVIGNTSEFLNTHYMGISREKIMKKVIKHDNWTGEAEQTTKEGKIISIWGSTSTIKDETDKIIGFLSVNNDFTERKHAEEVLKKSRDELEKRVQERTAELSAERQRLYDVLETLPVMICLLTKEYHVAFANRSFRQRFGESKGRKCYEYRFGFKEPCEFCESYKVFETCKPHYWEINTPDGTIIYAYDFPFTDMDGSSLILEMDIDITEQKQSEKALRKAHDELKETVKELERSNKELQSFAYITSHDLQEPLRTIASYAQLIKMRYKGQLDADADEFIDFMVSGATRMKSMVQGLLDYSRAGTHGEAFSEFNAANALNHALLNLRSSIKECNAEVNYGPLPVIFADESQITRIVQNLIGNALKFRKKGITPKIHISTRKTAHEHIFSVKDNGIGLEEQYTTKIFEVFKRLHSIGEYEGAGIGLAIVKRIIDRHCGHVWVESEYGNGSTFYFTITIKDV